VYDVAELILPLFYSDAIV